MSRLKKHSARSASFASLAVLALLAWTPVASAQEEEAAEPEKPWSNETQFNYVNTSGNTGTTTFGLTNEFRYNWTYSELVGFVDLFKATATTRQLFNEGGGVRQEKTNETTASRYEIALTYRQNFMDNVYWYGLGSWFRNTPAGLDARWIGSVGVGYRFIENEQTLLAGEIGAGGTSEQFVQGGSDTFADLRAFAELKQTISGSTDLRGDVEFLYNLQNSSDLRINSRASLTTAISDTFAMRLGWDLKFDNDPVMVLVDTNPSEPPAFFTLKTTDRTLTAAIVVSF